MSAILSRAPYGMDMGSILKNPMAGGRPDG